MMDGAVHPLMLDSAEGADRVSQALSLQRQFERLAQELSERQSDPSLSWRDGFTRLGELFEHQRALEEVAFMTRVPKLAPERVADMTRTALAIRSSRAARVA
jgi:hypothetical protein